MGDLIDLSTNSNAKLKAELKQKDEKIAELEKQLIDTKGKIAGMVSVNEMLRFALSDLEGTLTLYRDQITGMINNIRILRSKLPVIDSRIYGTKTQDRKPPDDTV